MREDIPVRERCRFRNLALGTATLTRADRTQANGSRQPGRFEDGTAERD